MQASVVVPSAPGSALPVWAFSRSVSAPRDLSTRQRWILAGSVLIVHGVLGWLIARARPTEAPAADMPPIMVELIAPVKAPPIVAPAPRPPAPVQPRKVEPPKPVLSTKAPSRNQLQAPPEPAKPAPAEIPPAPIPPAPVPAAATITAPAASEVAAPAPPPEPQPPRQLSISSVSYAVPLAVTYPETSRRLGESGVVQLQLLVDERGRAIEVRVLKSSGYSRLDQAAISAMKAARFRPYMEGGVPRAFRVTAPVIYDLSE